MAFHDWNSDGKKNLTDDYIDYQIYKNSTGKSSNNSYIPGGNRISTIGAIVATVGGLFGACAILAILGGGEDTSVLLIIILWAICGTGLSVWFDNIGF